MATPPRDVKPDIKAGEKINVLVREQNNGELVFKVKMSTPFSKIAGAFCKNRSIKDPRTLRFLSEGGIRLQGDEQRMIAELDLEPEENDEGMPTIYLDVYSEQLGGGE